MLSGLLGFDKLKQTMKNTNKKKQVLFTHPQ